MMKDTEVNFKWSNYFRPTPKNLQYFATSLKGLVVGLAGGSWIAGAESWVPLSIAAAGLVLDEIIKFLGFVHEEESKRVISVEVDADTDIEIKDNIVKE